MTIDVMEAWVLHKRSSGETSAYVTFFTREKGAVRCLYKGARTPKKQALLQAFSPLWLAITSRNDVHFVRHVEAVSPSLTLARDNLFAGLYVNELLYHALKEQDAYSELYDTYTQTLHALMTALDRFAVEMILRRFEWALLCACGYSMSLTHEIEDARPIAAENRYQFIVGEGFIRDERGLPGTDILALAQGCLDNRSVLKTAKSIMRLAIDHLLDGRPIKARELYCARV